MGQGEQTHEDIWDRMSLREHSRFASVVSTLHPVFLYPRRNIVGCDNNASCKINPAQTCHSSGVHVDGFIAQG